MKINESLATHISATAESEFVKRRKAIAHKINGGIALISSGSEKTETRDQLYAFRADSDFAYLCGLREPDALLVIDSRGADSRSDFQTLLYLRERNKQAETWTGERLGLRRATALFQVDEARDIANLGKDFPELCRNANLLAFNSGTAPELDNLIYRSFSSPVTPHSRFPSTLLDIRSVTAELRLTKSKEEVDAIRKAVYATAQGISQAIKFALEVHHQVEGNTPKKGKPTIATTLSERAFASLIEQYFIANGAERTAFHTIVASGDHATCLHHTPTNRVMKNGNLVLIDAGARVGDYNGDISRVFPVNGKFSLAQAAVYDVVHEALKTACSISKPGVSLSQIHRKACDTLLLGLHDLGLVKKSMSAKKKTEILSRYYMHNTSHFLGLDVHDINPLFRSSHGKPLSPHELDLATGAVFTVEPGLYFPKNDSLLPPELRGIGIRLEEDVHITSKGYEVLSNTIDVSRRFYAG